MVVGWQEKVWQEKSRQQHIEDLEKELKKTPCSALRAHIQQLKKAWGISTPSLAAA